MLAQREARHQVLLAAGPTAQDRGVERPSHSVIIYYLTHGALLPCVEDRHRGPFEPVESSKEINHLCHRRPFPGVVLGVEPDGGWVSGFEICEPDKGDVVAAF